MNTRITQVLALSVSSLIPLAMAQTDAPSDSEEVFELSPFIVQAGESASYLRQNASTGTVVAMDRVEIPMDITVVGENLIEDLALYNADDLGQVVAGASSTESVNTSGGGGNTVYTMRGFRSVPRRNGFASGGRLYDTTSVARVEVIKGPNSLLYGQTDPGGVINYIPKRPIFSRLNTLAVTLGSYDSFRVMGDTTGPIGEGNKLAYRIPFSYSEDGSDINFFDKKRFVIAPSLLYRIGKKTEIVLETEYLDDEVNLADNSVWWTRDAAGNLVTDYDRAGLGRSFNELGPDTFSTNKQFNVTGSITTQVGEHLHLRGMYSYNERDTVIRSVVLANNENRQVTRGGNYAAFMAYPINRVKGYKLDVLYDRTFGGLKTKTLFGFEQNKNFFGNSRYNTVSRLPALPNPLEGEPITEDDWAWTLGDPFTNPENFRLVNNHPTWSRSEWINARITETIHAFDDRFILLAGLAYGESERVGKLGEPPPAENEVTHFFGATYKINPKVAFFANSSESFAPVFRTGLDNRPLDPSNGQGFETGIKFDLRDTGLFATLTYFSLANEGLPRSVPADQSPTGEAFWVNSGEEEAKGAEIELFWDINKQLELVVSFVNFDAKLVSSNNNVGLPGQDLPRVPQAAGQVTLNYRFAKDSTLKGLRVGLNGNYADSAAIKPNFTDPSLRSDEYFVLNGFVRFKLPTERDAELFLNVKNILDEKYIRSNGFYGDLRGLSGGMRFKF